MEPTRPLISRARAGALFAGAGAALVAAQALLPAFPSGTVGQVAAAAEHRGAEAGSAAAFLVAGILLVLGVASSNTVTLGRGRTLTRVGLLMTGIGALWPVAGRAAFNAILVAATGADVQRSAAVDVVQAVGNSPAFAIFLPLLACFAVGPVLFAFGLRRARLLPAWPGVLWLVGVLVVNGAEDSSRLVATAGMVLVATALVRIGTALAKTPAGDTAAIQPERRSALLPAG